MTIYRNSETAELINDWPAWNSYRYEASYHGAVELKDGDELDFEGKNGNYKIGSVVSYAIKSNECPIEAYERAVRLGHETHYIVALGSCISAHKRAKKTKVYVDRETTYKFEGRFFRITTAPNNNLRLVEVKQ